MKWHFLEVTAGKSNSTKLVIRIPASLRRQYSGHKDRGQATMKLKVNTPPTMGRCAITPDSGNSGVTKFHITCEGFIDEDKFPLTYEFFQDADLDNPGLGIYNGCQEVSCSNLSPEPAAGVLLSYKLVPNAPNLVLMEGKEESGFKTELTVRVSDHWGMNVLYNFTAVVSPSFHTGILSAWSKTLDSHCSRSPFTERSDPRRGISRVVSPSSLHANASTLS
uniref:PKD/REJ-like domain-containing protein n=1 Tax=Timema cristinae TaxID=61476 RepID=A0A7R9D5A7_TIMCR|nr:unnamed protein product [Timema cristinae]